MRTDLVIRRERPEDRAAVVALIDRAFLTRAQPEDAVSASSAGSGGVSGSGAGPDDSVTDGTVTDGAVRGGAMVSGAAVLVSDSTVLGGGMDLAAIGGGSVESSLVKQLWNDADVIADLTFVAELEGKVVGQVTCSRATLSGRLSVGLGPISVAPELQRQGIGAALMAAVIASADQQHVAEIVLVGDPDYYGHFGFVSASTRGITSDRPWGSDPYFQVKPLRAWTADRTGEFDYARAFKELARTQA